MDLMKVCRTCLLPSASMLSMFISIQDSNVEVTKIPILQFLKFMTKISVSPNDGLPVNICCNCLDKVQKSFTFKLKCEKSETTLRQLKDVGKSVNELRKSPSKNQHRTEKRIEREPIKKEKTEYLETLKDEQSKETGSTDEDPSLLQDVKHEPEIEINMEEGDFSATDDDDLSYSASSTSHVAGRKTAKQFKCDICARLFVNKYRLTRHMITHSEEKPFQCELCEKNFRFKCSLKNHLQTVHSDEPPNKKKFECAACSKFFGRKFHLEQHLTIHTGEKPFQCRICQKEFRLMRNLTAHLQTMHDDGKGTTNIKRFQCATCSRLFGSKSKLSEHMIIHTEEKPFWCDMCPKKFRFKCSLRSHAQSTHADSTKFKCVVCSKLFAHKMSLNHHMTIHTGEKPFQCDACTKDFRLKRSLTKHMQRIHGVLPQNSKVIVAQPQ